MGHLGWKFVGNHRTGDNVCNYIKDKLETYTESAYSRHGSGVSIFLYCTCLLGGGGNGQIVILENYFCLKWDKLFIFKNLKKQHIRSFFSCFDTYNIIRALCSPICTESWVLIIGHSEC